MTSNTTQASSNADWPGPNKVELLTSGKVTSESNMDEEGPPPQDCLQRSGSHCVGKRGKREPDIVVGAADSQEIGKGKQH